MLALVVQQLFNIFAFPNETTFHMLKKISPLLLVVLLLCFENTVQARTETVRDSIINFAYNYLNTPYRRGGMSPKAFDCSGFSSFIFKQFGYQLNRTSCGQGNDGVEVDRNSLQPGDLVLFKGRNAKANRIGHVGIVVSADPEGNFTFIHASVNDGVRINNIDQEYYKKRYVTARRVICQEWEKILEVSPLLPKPIGVAACPPFPAILSENLQPSFVSSVKKNKLVRRRT